MGDARLGDLGRPLPGRSRKRARRLLALATTLALAITLLFGIDLAQTYRATRAGLLERARIAAVLVEDTLTRTLESTETILHALGDEAAHATGPDPDNFLRVQAGRLMRNAPHIRQIVLTRADGTILLDTADRSVGQRLDMDALDLPALAPLATESTLAIAVPRKGRLLPTLDAPEGPTPTRLMPVRVVIAPDLLAFAALNPVALESILAGPLLGHQSGLRLVRPDGTLVLQPLGGLALPAPLMASPGFPSGPGQETSAGFSVVSLPGSGQSVRIGLRPSSQYPLVVQSLVTSRDVQTLWARTFGSLIFWSVIALVALFVLGSLLAAEIIRRADLESQVRLLSLTRKVFAHSADAIVVTDADNAIISVNPTFTEITGYSARDVLGRNPRLLASGRHDQAFYKAMWESLEETGHWRGEIWNRRRDGTVYAQRLTISRLNDEAGRALNYIGIFSDITEQRQRADALNHQAHHDALTGLPNRGLLMDRLGQGLIRAERDGAMLAVLFLDLDGFKPVNDTFGHRSGDGVLAEVARRLQAGLRQSDTVARLGGDEFVVVLHDITSPEAAVVLANKLIDDIGQPLALEGGQEVTLGASIGLALFPRHGTDARSLLAAADGAMYQAKRAGGRRAQLCGE
ncbi:diguanylate cyclase domain-containing protein [Pararhodospirillum oryzae]|uniref:Diguanylate cyclase n=1 Tax=Pararhodospirillum oryzae TaxID=478448 RepID=A0A512H787_9PROT|nr:diguanylate cyclase [Pararhodospirillum oryzae]GEO81301.1 hypothetical protein ROR02_14320 [Pararhodospirillum oryzae]